MTTETTAQYEIVVPLMPGQHARGDEWTADGLGTPNTFDNLGAARWGIATLRGLGDEWADSTYGIRVVGERWPVEIEDAAALDAVQPRREGAE